MINGTSWPSPSYYSTVLALSLSCTVEDWPSLSWDAQDGLDQVFVECGFAQHSPQGIISWVGPDTVLLDKKFYLFIKKFEKYKIDMIYEKTNISNTNWYILI